MYICSCTSYYRELVVGLRTQFCTLLEMVLEYDYIPHTYKILGTQFCETLSHPSSRTFHLLELTTLI
jgi:hypothetical protein